MKKKEKNLVLNFDTERSESLQSKPKAHTNTSHKGSGRNLRIELMCVGARKLKW